MAAAPTALPSDAALPHPDDADVQHVRLMCVQGPYRGQSFEIRPDPNVGFLTTIVLGRTHKFFGCGVSLSQDHEVSTRHALIECVQPDDDAPDGTLPQYFLRDLHSTNGTALNGLDIPSGEMFALSPGDVIRVGATELTWHPPGGAGGLRGLLWRVASPVSSLAAGLRTPYFARGKEVDFSDEDDANSRKWRDSLARALRRAAVAAAVCLLTFFLVQVILILWGGWTAAMAQQRLATEAAARAKLPPTPRWTLPDKSLIRQQMRDAMGLDMLELRLARLGRQASAADTLRRILAVIMTALARRTAALQRGGSGGDKDDRWLRAAATKAMVAARALAKEHAEAALLSARTEAIAGLYGEGGTAKSHPLATDSFDAAINRYAADDIGRPDFALRTTGGSIWHVEQNEAPERDCSSDAARAAAASAGGVSGGAGLGCNAERIYDRTAESLQQFAKPITRRVDKGWRKIVPEGAERAIDAHRRVGDCFPFPGQTANITVKLSKCLTVEAVSMEHVSTRVAHDR
eukprot:g708.t1